MLCWFVPNETLKNIDRKLGRIMADIAGLQAAATQLQTDVGEATAELQRLGQVIRDGGNITQEEIDAVTETLTSSSSALDEAVAEDETA